MANYDPGFAAFMQDLLDAAKAKLYGLGGVAPNRKYTTDVNPEFDPNTKYFLKGTYRDEKGEYAGDYTPLLGQKENTPDRYPNRPEFNEREINQKTRPFIRERETVEDYMRRAAVSDIPENLLVRDGEGRIVGMVQPPEPQYVIPDRRGSQFFAP